MKKILIVEDDVQIALAVQKYLQDEAYAVEVIHQIKDFKNEKNKYDLYVFDWMLPDGSGFDLLKQVRSKQDATPIIFLTAKSDLTDKVLALESGAEDYLTKPFELRELLARIRVHLRQKNSEVAEFIEIGLIRIRVKSREVLLENKLVETTRKEFELLFLLMQHPESVFTRDELLNKIWGFENFPTTRTVDTHILQLRQKFGENIIQTMRGVGYRFKDSKELTKA